MQKILEQFVIEFCEKHKDQIETTAVKNYVKRIGNVFNYDGKLTIHDVLVAMIFNVVEYSMNRIFIEQYWDHQKYFPTTSSSFILKSKSKSKSMSLSRSNYSSFMNFNIINLVDKNDKNKLLNEMKILYKKFKTDDVAFVECINPHRMKSCVLCI